MDEKVLLGDAVQYANNNLCTSYLNGFLIQAEDLVFEERVKMNCYYCGRYNSNWKCPPNLPDIDYSRMFKEFNCCAAVYVEVPFDSTNYQDVRTESSLLLHRGLLLCEKYMWNNNNPTTLSFIGGGCKLCKNGCGKERCNNPYMSRSPIEATGVNIVKSLKKYNFEITFPPKEKLIRCGLLLW